MTQKKHLCLSLVAGVNFGIKLACHIYWDDCCLLTFETRYLGTTATWEARNSNRHRRIYMADIDKVRSQVRSHLIYNYPGNPDDEDGTGDGIWINKNQKYEVDYAIAKCLIDCNAASLAADTELVRNLERMIQEMEHDNLGRCKREDAYPKLKHAIAVKQLARMISRKKK